MVNMIDYDTITKNCKEGVSIVYIPERKLWGVQLKKEDKAVFYSSFRKVIDHLCHLPTTATSQNVSEKTKEKKTPKPTVQQ